MCKESQRILKLIIYCEVQMNILKTTFMGVSLNSPIIAGAGSIGADLNKAKDLENAGTGAIVYKSLFEQQIELESLQIEEQIEQYSERNAEMISIFPKFKHAGPIEHLEKLRELKKILSIPLIASINCIEYESWIDYCLQAEKTGIDGIELNFYSSDFDKTKTADSIESYQKNVIKKVSSSVKIPVSIKLSSFYANPVNAVCGFDKEGAKGFVLFHREFTPGIDIQKEKYRYPLQLSNSLGSNTAQRFAALIYKNIKSEICCSTAVFESADVLKMILSGASCVQMVSAVYKKGVKHIAVVLKEITDWMNERDYKSIEEIRGKLSKDSMKDPLFSSRSSYIEILANNEAIILKEFAR